jgi:hypothetical protein
MNVLKKIDAFGKQFQLNVKGETSYKTIFGAILSILAYSSIIFLFFILGRNFYERENPFASMSKTLNAEGYFNYTLNASSFVFGFNVEDQNNNILIRPDHFYIEPHYILYKVNSDGTLSKLVDKIIGYHRCKPEDFNYNPGFNLDKVSNYYCFDNYTTQNIEIGGLWDSDVFSYIKIKLKNCAQGGQYNKKNNITCSKNETELRNFFNNYIYFGLVIQNYFMDVNNYTYPFKTGFQELYETIDIKVQKKIYYYFKKGVILDKKGWFTEEYEHSELIGVDRTRSDSMTAITDIYSSTYYETNLYFDKIVETFNRRYMKAQELVANIGGILKAITFIVGLVSYFYNGYYGYLDIINENFTPIKNLSKLTNIYDNYEKKMKMLKSYKQISSDIKLGTFNTFENALTKEHQNKNIRNLDEVNNYSSKHINSPASPKKLKNRENTWNSLYKSEEINENTRINNKQKIDIDLYQYYCFCCFNRQASRKIKIKKKLFNEAEIIIKNKIDVAYLIPFIEVVEEELYKIKSSKENKEEKKKTLC